MIIFGCMYSSLQSLQNFLSALEKELPVKVSCDMEENGVYRIFYAQHTPIFFYLISEERVNSNTPAIHITCDEWFQKRQIILDRISVIWGYATRVHARKTACMRVDKKTALRFLEENHMMVPVSGKYRYGLFLNGELITIAVFSGLRNMDFQKNYKSIELIRFCHKGKITVIGGLSKLIKTMTRALQPDDVMTYIDKNWSDGKKFEKIGFRKTGNKVIKGGRAESIKMILLTKEMK